MAQAQGIDEYFVIFAGTAGMIVLALGIILFFVIYRKKLVEEKWQQQRLITEFQSGLLNSNIKAIEKERARIASDLHDDIGSRLSALRLQLIQLNKRRAMLPDDMVNVKDIIDQTIDTVRRISYDLHPPGLEDFGLEFAIKNLCDKIAKHSDLTIDVSIDLAGERYEYMIELSLYRILQELITNTLKHSGATITTISIVNQPGELQMTYSDNGKGYDYSPNLTGSSLGLKNIAGRINLVQGTIRYHQQDGNTQVLINVPIDRNSIL